MKRSLDHHSNKIYQQDFIYPFFLTSLADVFCFGCTFKFQGNDEMRKLMLSKYADQVSLIVSQVIEDMIIAPDFRESMLHNLLLKKIGDDPKIKVNPDFTLGMKNGIDQLKVDIKKTGNVIESWQYYLQRTIANIQKLIARFHADILKYELSLKSPKSTIGSSLFMSIMALHTLLAMINELGKKTNNGWEPIRRYLISQELIAYDKPPESMSQMEITDTIYLLTDKWNTLNLFAPVVRDNIKKYTTLLEARLAYLFNNMLDFRVLDGKIELQIDLKVHKNKKLYICSEDYKADMTSIFAVFYKSLCIIEHMWKPMNNLYKHKGYFGGLLDSPQLSFATMRSMCSFDTSKKAMVSTDNGPISWFGYPCIELVQKFDAWFNTQLEVYSSMNYRKSIGDKWIDFFLRAGELDRFERNRAFVSTLYPTEAVSFCRGKNVLTYWNDFVNKFEYTKLFKDNSTMFSDIFLMFMLDKFFDSIQCKFEQEVVILEKEFYLKKKDMLLFRNYPFIIQIHNQWFVVLKCKGGDKWELHRSVNFKNSFIIWMLIINKQNINTEVIKLGRSSIATIKMNSLLMEMFAIPIADLSAGSTVDPTTVKSQSNVIRI